MHKMSIAAPFRTKEEVLPLIKGGADELYCGYLSPEWEKKYTSLEFERKGGRESNFTDLDKLKESVAVAHGKNTPVYLTLNGLYVKQQYPLLMKIISLLDKTELDGYIVADIGLLLALKKRNAKKRIHLSTGGTVFNSETVSFYKNLGVSRIVLDRQTTIKAMDALSKENPGIEFEVFILSTLCMYIDGFCTFLHAYSGNEGLNNYPRNKGIERKGVRIVTAYDCKSMTDACHLKYSVQAFNPDLTKRLNSTLISPVFYKHMVDGNECGACALYDIGRTRVKSLKIVGRQFSPGMRLKCTKFIRQALDIWDGNRSIRRQDFISRVQKLYQETFQYKDKCRGNNCYYPEAIHGKGVIN